MERRALAIFAHPDDVDFGAAGTVAQWVDDGWDVRYVCVTRGQKGAWDAHMDVEEYGALRETEQRAAAKVVGVTDVLFLLALTRAGARRWLVLAAGAGTAALETQRALARRRRDPVTTVTAGERPFRVGYVAAALVSSPSAGAAVLAGTTLTGALALYRRRRYR